MGGYALSFVLSSLLGAVLSWRAVGEQIHLTLPVFSWFASPTLAACLATAWGELLERILLRDGLAPLPSALSALGLGVVLYLAALQAMGVGKRAGKLP
jgi:hypothetical protein